MKVALCEEKMILDLGKIGQVRKKLIGKTLTPEESTLPGSIQVRDKAVVSYFRRALLGM